MGKYQDKDNESGRALQRLLEGEGKRDPADSHTIYIDEEEKDHAAGNVAGAVLNGKTLMSLGSITPGSNPYTYLFRKSMSAKGSRRGIRKRVVFKNGDCNVTQENVAKRRRRYLADIFTTLVDIQWRYNLMVFSLGFILSWLCFAVVWWLICFTHGDLQRISSDAETFTPCVQNLHSFTSAFLFSIETQHTIGYGSRFITDECPEAIFIMCVQSIAGVMIQAFMVGVVFAKLSRPKKRTQTLLFSRNAVVALRDGMLCLMFRVGDMRRSHIIESHVKAQLIKKKVTEEGEVLPHYFHEVAVNFDTGDNQIFFIWPCTLVHVIDKNSPFFNMSASDMMRESFEMVVILEGCIESTGMTTQARSSYLPSEILWGHRFEQLVQYRKETGEYEVDYSLFNNTYEVETPLCSARQLIEYQQSGVNWRKHASKKGNHRVTLRRSHSMENLKKSNTGRKQKTADSSASTTPSTPTSAPPVMEEANV